MLKKTMTYEDFDGNSVTEDFYFHLTKAEMFELEIASKGNSLSKAIDDIVKAKDGQGVIDTFKRVIGMSIGKRSEDGRRFDKSDEIRADFMATNAYSDLFYELATNAEAGAAFINGLVPKQYEEQVAAATSEVLGRNVELTTDPTPEPAKTFETEVLAPKPEQIVWGLATDGYPTKNGERVTEKDLMTAPKEVLLQAFRSRNSG